MIRRQSEVTKELISVTRELAVEVRTANAKADRQNEQSLALDRSMRFLAWVGVALGTIQIRVALWALWKP